MKLGDIKKIAKDFLFDTDEKLSDILKYKSPKEWHERNNIENDKSNPKRSYISMDLISMEGLLDTYGGVLNLSFNNLSSFEYCPKNVNIFILSNNKFKNLHNIHKFIKSAKNIYCDGNPIKSHVLGLLKIKGLQGVMLSNLEVQKIINKYLPEGDILACQQELIEAGFEEYAQL